MTRADGRRRPRGHRDASPTSWPSPAGAAVPAGRCAAGSGTARAGRGVVDAARPPRRRRPPSPSSACAALTLIAGYIGTLIAQTITFAADEFGASRPGPGHGPGRHGPGRRAPRPRPGGGGRPAGAAAIDPGQRLRRRARSTATGALRPEPGRLGVSQTVARGLSTALALLIAILAAEQVPRNSRAWTVSILALTGALGSGMAVWLLPLADLGEPAWRLLYLVPLVGIPFTRGGRGGCPSPTRFVAAVERPRPGPPPAASGCWPSRPSSPRSSSPPPVQFLNDFLRDDLGFSAARITAFTLLTNTPGVIGIVIGGRLADLPGPAARRRRGHGRRGGPDRGHVPEPGLGPVGLLDRRPRSSAPPPSPPSASTDPSCSPPPPGAGPTASSPCSA